jgi:predicted nucleotidyltransferase component of viral defense system
VMSTISKSGVCFYLSSGTALSRANYNHRYSDDLEFFVNDNENKVQMKEVFSGPKMPRHFSFKGPL